MDRTIWCRHDDCDHVDVERAGRRPNICVGCRRVAAWTTEPKTEATIIRPARAYPGDPAKPYRLSMNDRQFLRSLRIEALDETDVADGA